MNLNELEKAGARYVTFSCNAYSCGALSPNLMVGWMNSAYPMTVSDKDGVAYDPSCVQHVVRVDESNLSKGLVFGVLNVQRREIVWLEMPYTSQTILGVDAASVETLLKRLEEKNDGWRTAGNKSRGTRRNVSWKRKRCRGTLHLPMGTEYRGGEQAVVGLG